ncbi:MAG: glycosyl transferase [Isosphaeraceae bacterium]|jgi:glycosyltransferase involved in cell wall biosynthesis|nr:MAG: glycosyl transferase [Isosphaeraceae bacterium]
MPIVRQDGSHGLPAAAPSEPGAALRPALGPGELPRFLSIIVPAKNEASGLPRLVAEIAAAFRPLLARDRASGHRLDGFETIIVDDGSTDQTPQILAHLMADHPELRPLRLARNAGQSAATRAGFHAARGQWVAILDADLQNDPADLARLWDLLPGYDAGLGWRVKRRDTWSKRVISKIANRVRDWVLGDSVKDTGCAVRIFPRQVALRLPMFHGAHRFYGPLLLREGCRIVQMPCNHRPRPHGRSHYNLWNRSFNVVVDLLGVAWLMRRRVVYELRPLLDEPASPTPTMPPVGAALATRSTLSRTPS